VSKRFDPNSVLPYGKWTCADGREVLFNRFYGPIWQRSDGLTTAADSTEWVKHIQQEWFYSDGTPRRGLQSRLNQILDDFGVRR
jgi:hypothetical protein